MFVIVRRIDMGTGAKPTERYASVSRQEVVV
jgi:hypothetical protein